MKTALLFQSDNLVGCEYLRALDAAGRRPDLMVAAGRMSDASLARERARTGGLWAPPPIPPELDIARFERLDDPALARLLTVHGVDVAIQGGVGIVKPALLAVPRIGFLNVHPGRLPQFRGSSCPEWAVFEEQPVMLTAHLLDAGLDTGPVVCARPYAVDFAASYEAFRAGIYPACARVLVEALERLAAEGAVAATPQPEDGARRCVPAPPEVMERVRARFAA